MKPALHFPRFGKTLLAAALVATFGIAGLPAEAKPKQASAAAGKPIKGEINAAKALTFMYGNAAANSANDAKMGRTHQYCLCFVKGDPKKATERLGDVELPDLQGYVDGEEIED